MIVGIWRASFLFRSWRKKLQEAEIVDVILSFNNDCDRQQNQSDFQMVCYDICSCSAWRTVFRSCLGKAWSSSLEGMPCNSDMYVYLSIEVVIGLIQWSPLLRCQVVIQILWVVVVGGISVVFSHSVEWVWWSRLSFLMLVFVIVFDLYYCIIYFT